MKVRIEQPEHSTERLNKALEAFTEVLNQHFVGSGGSIKLHESEKLKSNWMITIEIGWEKVDKS